MIHKELIVELIVTFTKTKLEKHEIIVKLSRVRIFHLWLDIGILTVNYIKFCSPRRFHKKNSVCYY